MNPEELPPPPQPPQAQLKPTTCDRHPDEQFTGFCPSCLCERLAVLDKTCSSTTTSGRKSASSAIKSLFNKSSSSVNNNNNNNNSEAARGRLSSSSFLPELRRTKSFSGGKNVSEGGLFSAAFEPQRKSCDVGGRSTLFSLFSQDDVQKRTLPPHTHRSSSGTAAAVSVNEASASTSSAAAAAVVTAAAAAAAVELKKERIDHVVNEIEEEEEEFHDSNNGEEITVAEIEQNEIGEFSNYNNNNNNYTSSVDKFASSSGEQLSSNGVIPRPQELRPMKDHIDLDSQNKKVGGSKDLKELAGSFWSAASVFSKKLRSWTKKNNKIKKHHHHHHISGSHTVEVSGKKGRKYNYSNRDTQSEIADYGFGRRSCDTDPRFSLDAGRFSVDAATAMAGRFSVDAGRMSFDDVRCSFDEPRASWDGYLIGNNGRNFTVPRMIPPMVSVVEDAPAPAPVVVTRKDAQILLEEPRRSSVSINGDEPMPGNAAQTKDYYSDSSSKRRKSLDRSSSIRKTAAAVVDEMKNDSNNVNVKIPHPHAHPHVDVDYLQGTKVVAAASAVAGDNRDFHFRDFDLLNSNSNSHSLRLRDDYSESFDMGCRDNASVIGGSNCDRRGSKKSSSRWKTWNIWSLLYRRGGSTKDDDDDDDRYSRATGVGVERSYSESWNGDPRGGFSRNVLRSNSSVSWRNSSYNNIGGGSIKKGGTATIDSSKKKKGDEFVLERNRSARYSPSHTDNGMLRFYLTPLRGSRRGKPKPAYSHSFARSVLRLY